MENEILMELVNLAKTWLECLKGVYLHGSLAMGCYVPGKSDLDVLVVIDTDIPDFIKRAFIADLIALEEQHDLVKIEMSIVLEQTVRHFEHPSPFVLHYSAEHKGRYFEDPAYLCSDGVDPDLAAHFTVTYNRGRTLYGVPIQEMFSPVPRSAYVKSLLFDIEHAESGIVQNPVYYGLNLCRVLYFLEEGEVSSKKEGGEWFLQWSQEYRNVIEGLLGKYQNVSNTTPDSEELKAFANAMMDKIKRRIESTI